MDKKHILHEIRRTAQENAGVPLGALRFSKETGIKESDWKGRLWARWGDALREAGLEPNRFNVPFDESFLLKKYIDLVRELGRLPVSAELRMKASSDSTFPSRDALGRWGGKVDLVARLAEFCRKHAEFTDILGYCEEYLSKTRPPKKGVSSPNEITGFVYLIKFGRHYKIGRSNAAGRRERELAIQLPDKTRTIHVIRTDDPVGIEAYWHKRFEKKRGNGEWFALNAEDIAAFRRRKFM